MRVVPAAMVEVSCQGIVNIRGETAGMPVFMLKDKKERSIAIPLGNLETQLLQHTLGGNVEKPEPPQPYRTLLSCLDTLGVELGAVHIHYNSEYDLPTHLILRPKPGAESEVALACVDGIIYSRLSGAPIYVDEELMANIGMCPSESNANNLAVVPEESDAPLE